MADLDVTKNSPFITLSTVSTSPSLTLSAGCRSLEETRMFPSKYLRLFQGFAQELQAEINQELLLPLHEREMDDWNRYGKVRQAWEKYLKDPDDVFIDAEIRRAELRRQGKKPPHVKKRGR
jgi:hypothetical protein